MTEINITTTDDAFVEDLNSAGLAGVRAKYEPKLAFDTKEHIFQIVVEAVSSVAVVLFAKWLEIRLQRSPARQSSTTIIINQTNISAQTVVMQIRQVTERSADEK